MESKEQIPTEMLAILEDLGKSIETSIESLQQLLLKIGASKHWVKGRSEEAEKKDE